MARSATGLTGTSQAIKPAARAAVHAVITMMTLTMTHASAIARARLRTLFTTTVVHAQMINGGLHV
jgi:hypothetical protein